MVQLSLFKDAFLSPLHHSGRALTFIGISLGSAGFNLLNIALVYALVGTNMAQMMEYIVTMIAFESFIVSPLVYYFYRCHDGVVFRAGLIALLLCGLGGAIVYQPSGWVLGIFIGAVFGTMYPSHHCAMLANTSDEGRGFETALSQTISILLSVISSLLAGYLLHAGQTSVAVNIGAACMILGISLIFLASPWLPHKADADYMAEIRDSLKHKNIIGICLRFGAYDSIGWLAAAVAAVAGFTALATGGVLAISAALSIILTPLVGVMIHQKKNHEHIVGHVLVAIGWGFVLLLPKTPLFFTIGTLVAALGMQAIIPSMQAAWYNLKMPGAVMVKEASLGLTRTVFISLLSLIIPHGLPAIYAFMLVIILASLFYEIKKRKI